MILLSDFDGVFTEPQAEAASVTAYIEAQVADRAGEAGLAELEEARAAVRAEPTAHGWFYDGVLSAYADEDPYIFNNATAAAIYAADGALAAALREGGFETHDAFSMACFTAGTEAWRAANSTHLLPEAVEALERFLAKGWEVVVVSNSSPERVASILSERGISEASHPGLSLKGGALKFGISPIPQFGVPQSAAFGAREVRLDRGHYLNIIDAVKPHAVIGDVLSLDLALPAQIRDVIPEAKELQVFLKQNDYTPAWTLEACEARQITPVATLLELAERLL